MDELVSRIVDLLKSSGWQLAGLSVGLLAYVSFRLSGAAPVETDAFLSWALLLGFASAGIAGGAACQWGAHLMQRAVAYGGQVLARRREKQRFKNYIPHLTERERRILGLLLATNRKVIETDVTGEHAYGLIAQGFLRFQTAPGQAAIRIRVPVIVPDHIWEVMVENREALPAARLRDAAEGALPWQRPWSAREH